MTIGIFLKLIVNAFINFLKNKPLSRTNKNFKQNLALLIFILLSLLFLFSSFRVSEIIILTVVGIGCIYAGICMKKHIRNMEKNGIRTKARIIDFHIEERFTNLSRSRRNPRKVKFYYPIISFTNLNGNLTTQKMPDANTSPKEINDFIDILYLKNENKYEIISDNAWRKSYVPTIFIIFGIYCLLHSLSSGILFIKF